MDITFIRHGDVETEINEKGQKLIYNPASHLTPLGHEQMKALGKELQTSNVRFDALFVSPYTRAKESAAALITQLKIKPTLIELNDLHDTYAPGWWGKPFDDLIAVGGDIYGMEPLSADQETLHQLIHRAKKVMYKMNEISLKSSYESIGVVAHLDILSALAWTLKYPDIMPISYGEILNCLKLEKGEAWHNNTH